MLAEFNVKSKSKMLSTGHIVCIVKDIERLRHRPTHERHKFAKLTIKRTKRFARVCFHFFRDATYPRYELSCLAAV